MGYDYNSWEPVKVSPDDLTVEEIKLLRDSKRFCIYPWIHLHTYPTGETWPCCHAEMKAGPCGSTHEQPLKELWNSGRMKQLRMDMLHERENAWCTRCYEQEEAGFFSGRKSANKHHGHHVKKIVDTAPDGSHPHFEMTYWDIRFSNLCNLRCRTCGHIFSSSWYKDQVEISKRQGHEYKETPLHIAGRYETDMLEQVLEHIPSVEQIYFAGGEPLTMEEHYAILDELIAQQRTDVRLIYNTNFTKTKLKDKTIFDYWKEFPNVSVGASLDAMGERAEYLRKGTVWSEVEDNRLRMLEETPHVDFYISATLSIFNSLHIVDFHRDWTERGLIRAQDFNVNILQDPREYRIDIADTVFKKKLKATYLKHLEWLSDKDPLNRASTGYQSAITFMKGDNTFFIESFEEKTQLLDDIRGERLLSVFPELSGIDI